MEISAGIVITFNKKILLCHPTNSSIFGTWSIPKGHVEKGEKLIETACRETLEEIGLNLSCEDINSEPLKIEYKKKGSNAVYKTVYCFHYEVKTLSSIGLQNETLPFCKLQLEEVDFATFLDKENCQKYMFWRLEPILKFI